jgi:hypothetical protein
VLCSAALKRKPVLQIPVINWFAKFFVSSIYETEPLDEGLKEAFGSKQLFGHQGDGSRVAVTTTVNAECRLLTSFNWGDGNRYLDSNIQTWAA